MIAVFVSFTSTEESRISAVYMGRVPLAEHDNMPPFIANRAAGNVTTGGTNRLEINTFYPLCSLTEPYLFKLTLKKAHLAVVHAKIALIQNVALVDKLTHTYTRVYIFVEQGQVTSSKQPREKRTFDMCEKIIKHELPYFAFARSSFENRWPRHCL